MSCIDCIDSMEPPPDMILSMPPPPLPSFLLPKKPVSTSETTQQQQQQQQPCYAPFMCEKLSKRDFTGREFIELTQKDDTWLYIIVFTVVVVVVLCSIVGFIIVKCRKHYHSHDPKNKRPPPLDGTLHERHDDKSGTMMSGTMLYPFVQSAHYQSHGLGADNRMLWATITPHGTRHFVSESFVPQDDHYEIVDYHRHRGGGNVASSSSTATTSTTEKLHPTPLMESYNTDDMDSGYQEPNSIYEGSVRGQYVSSPTYIENPNLAPLNMHPPQSPASSSRSSLEIGTLTNNSRKGTISRRISDLPIRNARV